ncbi:hypothetical protein JDBNIEOD_01863 [Streptococcus equi subsp. zooepidemicus]|nr:hypothetical protein JDBNIEOD_01863 [Streptococcus equi subsp. zooepidemicus]
MRFLDLFAGIGGFRMALERQGHECVGFCEIDKFARSSYKASQVNSNSQLYKQAGNSVTVNVIEAIAKQFE